MNKDLTMKEKYEKPELQELLINVFPISAAGSVPKDKEEWEDPFGG